MSRTIEEEIKQKVHEGYILESPDEMTEGYRKALIVQLLVQADTELMSAPAYWMAAQDAPSTNTMVSAVAIIQDELAHANIAYRILEDMGLDKEQLVYGREPHEFKHPYGFDQPLESWAELVTANGFFDRAGITLLSDVYRNTSYGPLKRALVKVDLEETFHLRHGEVWMKRLARGRRGEGEAAARGRLDVPDDDRVVRPAGRHEAAQRPARVPAEGDDERRAAPDLDVGHGAAVRVARPRRAGALRRGAAASTCSTTRSRASTTRRRSTGTSPAARSRGTRSSRAGSGAAR
jgi:hypothetical protein